MPPEQVAEQIMGKTTAGSLHLELTATQLVLMKRFKQPSVTLPNYLSRRMVNIKTELIA